MRLLTLAGAFGLAIVATSQVATVADARPFAGPRFCAQIRGGGENCGYYTFNQCLASISGVGGYCIRRADPGRSAHRADAARPAHHRARRDRLRNSVARLE